MQRNLPCFRIPGQITPEAQAMTVANSASGPGCLYLTLLILQLDLQNNFTP